jgi:hypothetical protein
MQRWQPPKYQVWHCRQKRGGDFGSDTVREYVQGSRKSSMLRRETMQFHVPMPALVKRSGFTYWRCHPLMERWTWPLVGHRIRIAYGQALCDRCEPLPQVRDGPR